MGIKFPTITSHTRTHAHTTHARTPPFQLSVQECSNNTLTIKSYIRAVNFSELLFAYTDFKFPGCQFAHTHTQIRTLTQLISLIKVKVIL